MGSFSSFSSFKLRNTGTLAGCICRTNAFARCIRRTSRSLAGSLNNRVSAALFSLALASVLPPAEARKGVDIIISGGGRRPSYILNQEKQDKDEKTKKDDKGQTDDKAQTADKAQQKAENARKAAKVAELRRSMARCADDHAQYLYRRKDYEGALREVNQALLADARPQYVATRAKIYIAMERFQDAVKDFEMLGSQTDSTQELLTGAQLFRDAEKLQEALRLCNLSINASPTLDGYTLRSALHAATGNTTMAIADARKAYYLAFEYGLDPSTERAALRNLLGGAEPAMPIPPREKTAQVLDAVYRLANSPKPFSPVLTEKLAGIKLHELPLEDAPGVHTGSFESLRGGPDDLWFRIELDRPDAGGYRNCLHMIINTSACSITADDVRAKFGACELTPNLSTQCIIRPAALHYKRPWGELTFAFDDHGFKSMQSVHMNVEKPARSAPKPVAPLKKGSAKRNSTR